MWRTYCEYKERFEYFAQDNLVIGYALIGYIHIFFWLVGGFLHDINLNNKQKHRLVESKMNTILLKEMLVDTARRLEIQNESESHSTHVDGLF